MTRRVVLSAGPIDYADTGGAGPVLVLLHGLMMDASLWEAVIAELSVDHRCIAPTLPLGAHREPMRSDVPLSLPTVARLVGELLESLGLHDVWLVGNDTGGALVQLLAAEPPDRLAGIVLISCDAFDNLPPGLTGNVLVRSGSLSPRWFGCFMAQLRLRVVRRSPLAFGWLTKHGDAITRGWLDPVLTRPEIQRDTVRLLRSIAADRRLLVRTADALARFQRPALVVWASEDRVMPPAHGRRLAELLPQGRLVEVAESYTLIPLDQPQKLAHSIRTYIREAWHSMRDHTTEGSSHAASP